MCKTLKINKQLQFSPKYACWILPLHACIYYSLPYWLLATVAYGYNRTRVRRK